MQLLDYDYFSDKTDPNSGLIRLVGGIARARADLGEACLLFDNGDAIQGNPLADFLATQGMNGRTHPIIAAFNTLKYDGMALGNHEFNYGLDYLRQALSGAEFPIICANLSIKNEAPISRPFLILERTLTCDDGRTRPVKIGVTGFVTPQITQWDEPVLNNAVTTRDIVESAQQVVPDMKAAGADVIIALCHSGIGGIKHKQGMENAAVPLAAIDGIDVILTGHTHEMFPDKERVAKDVIDPVAGTLHGKPAVMAGFYGNRLGVIDLRLCWNDGVWQIIQQKTSLEKGEDETTQTKAVRAQIRAHVDDAHMRTLAHIRQPIAVTPHRIHSFFATLGPDPSQQLLARAQQNHVQDVLQGSAWENLPLISSTAPFRCGDRAGPGHYINIPAGPITLRDAAAIYPFANTLCGLRQSGADLRDWLERSASHFMQITPDEHNQPLIHPHSPGYNFDTIFGLDYEIDISKPARFDSEGRMINPDASRIKHLHYAGQRVQDTDQFVVATNSYRTFGGGGMLAINRDNILYNSTQSTRDILIDDLQARGTVEPDGTMPWRLTEFSDTSAIFASSPLAREHLTDKMERLGPGRDGFDEYRLYL